MSLVRSIHSSVVWDRRVSVLASVFARRMPEGSRVLDVGCGDGSIAASIIRQRPDVSISGIDVLRRPSTEIAVQEFDGITIPYPDDSFDVLMFVDVLHHTDDPKLLLKESARVTSGRVLIKDHLLTGFMAEPTLRMMDWIGNASHGVALPYNYWSQSQWESGFEETGLVADPPVTDLNLYRAPLSWIFERHLHVFWQLALEPPGPEEID